MATQEQKTVAFVRYPGLTLLEGRQATTHWAYHRLLERLGPPTCPSGGWRTAGSSPRPGVSAGIDMAWPWSPG